MNKIALLILLLLLLGLLTQGQAQNVNRSQEYETAKKLIEANCGDCRGGNREGLEKGISLLEKVIASGYKKELEAYKLLAYAYNEMAGAYLVTDPLQHKITVDKYKKVYEKLIQLAPNDPDILFEYAMTVLPREDTESQLTILQKVLRIDPNHRDANYIAGLILIEKGEYDEGIKDLKKGLDQFDYNQDFGTMMRAIEVLRKHGQKKEADEIQMKMDQHEKYVKGVDEIRFGDVSKGIKLVKESVQGDLRRLQEYEISMVIDALEGRQRYKEAADIYELIDSKKYKDQIQNLKEKAKTEQKKKP